MAKSGIGELLDIAIALHLGEPIEPVVEMHNMGAGALVPGGLLPGGRINPGLWAYERGKNTKHPREYLGPRGSANHKLVATLLDLLSAHNVQSGPIVWRSPAAWLTTWYEVMRDAGHDGHELLSTIYGGTHSIVAMIAADLGIPGAAEHLQRQVALYALHLTNDYVPFGEVLPTERLLVMPGCRSVRPKKGPDVAPEGLEQWSRYMLGEDHPERPRAKGGGRVKAGRELALARRLRARRFLAERMGFEVLPTVRSCVGTLVHRRHERGFVSYFETGPRCYAWPVAAVVCVDGAEPVVVRAPASAKGKGAGEVLATIEEGDLLDVSWPGGYFRDTLAPLGALVRETRIEGP